MPIKEVFSWLVTHVDVDIRMIKTENGKSIAFSFHPSSLDIYYKFPKTKVNMSEKWVAEG